MGASKTPESSSQRLTLRLPGQRPSAALIEDSPQPGVSVDNEALKREQELVRAGSNGQEDHTRTTPPVTRSLRKSAASPISNSEKGAASIQRGVSASSSSRSTVATFDNETQALPSASLGLVSSRESSHESVNPASTSPNRTPVSSAMGTAIPPPAIDISGDQSTSPWLPSNPAGQVVDAHSVLHISPLDSIVRPPGQGRQYVVKTSLIYS